MSKPQDNFLKTIKVQVQFHFLQKGIKAYVQLSYYYAYFHSM